MTQEKRNGKKHPVLFVDDEENTLHSMQRLFFNNPVIEIMTANSAGKAREILKTKPVHLLVTDQRMPGATGTELLSFAKKNFPDTLRILVTGYEDMNTIAESVNKGEIVRYYAKPFNPRAFIGDIEEILSGWERRNSEKILLAALHVRGLHAEGAKDRFPSYRMFDEFLKTVVKAVEDRDPYRSGHSFRVARTAVETARLLGGFDEVSYKELNYAALLHDIGTLSVDPELLRKRRKLFPRDLARIDLALDYLGRYQELRYAKHEIKLRELAREKGGNHDELIRMLHKEETDVLKSLRECRKTLHAIAETSTPPQEARTALEQVLAALGALKFLDYEGHPIHPLTEEDIANLSLSNGVWNKKEALDVAAQARLSQEIAKALPWPPRLGKVPDIVRKHREIIDNSGYRWENDPALSPPAMILAAADIYDTLSIRDEAEGTQGNVFTVLAEEVRTGRLNPRVVETLKKAASKRGEASLPGLLDA